MLDAFIMRGGPTTASRSIRPAISLIATRASRSPSNDGAAYARAGRVERDAGGALPEVFEFDADGDLVEVAEKRFTTLP